MITSQHTLNPIQLHLLEMFRHCDSDNMIEELKDVLAICGTTEPSTDKP